MSLLYDANSDFVKVIRLRADGAMSRGTLAEIVPPDASGDVLGAKAPVDENGVDRLVVALHDMADNDIGLFAVRGPVDLIVSGLTVSAYNGLKYHNGAIADAAHSGVTTGAEAGNDFAVVLSAISATDTIARVYLIGVPVTKST